VRRQISGWGTVAVALAGLLAAPLAAAQLTPLALTTALAVGAGAEAHARLHPRFGPVGSRRLNGFWIGPALAVLAAALVVGRVEGELGRGVPFVGALAVGALLFAQDRELDDLGHERWTPLAFALILYLVAFALFVVIYSAQEPIILSALACGVCASLLAVALFRPTRARRGRVWLLAALTGLCTAELTLALAAWLVAGLLGGAFLLLYFYVAAGLIHALLDGSLDRRLVVEYGFVGLIGLALIISTSPLRP
jgi:hypothetical protein